jgi:hypothetical protein
MDHSEKHYLQKKVIRYFGVKYLSRHNYLLRVSNTQLFAVNFTRCIKRGMRGIQIWVWSG